MVLNTETEERILASAEKLFYRKGKAGTSMQDIADDAGINRTLLNYYFRSKDQLFEAVFRNALKRFVPELVKMLRSEMSFEEYMPMLIETVIDTLLRNPQIPVFVLQELSSNPERMPMIMKEMGLDPSIAFRKIGEEKQRGRIGNGDPRQLIMNLLSLCIFPFAARPIVTEILFNGNEAEFETAMEERKLYLINLLKQLMTQNNPQ
jgi:TetR/AcrR family transcriptional regulator